MDTAAIATCLYARVVFMKRLIGCKDLIRRTASLTVRVFDVVFAYPIDI